MKLIKYLCLTYCVADGYQWRTHNNNIYLDNQVARIKGINWYGFETGSRCLDGLYSNPISYYIGALSSQRFNALRIPVSEQMILYDEKIVSKQSVLAEPKAYNRKPIEILDLLFEEALAKNMLILLDIHRLRYGISSPLWYLNENQKYTYESIQIAIDTLVDRYKKYPNFLGIDLFNEPHYEADYGSNNSTTDWKLFIEGTINSILPKYPDDSFLFFVNGIDWGKNFSKFVSDSLSISEDYMQKIVFSPHEYGPSITRVASYDKNRLFDVWDSLFGYMKNDPRYTICIGEWGGRFDDPDEKKWLDNFSQYMIEKNFTNNFFWALNPWSTDVRGLMIDWYTFSQEKLDFLANIQPFPSFFYIQDKHIQII